MSAEGRRFYLDITRLIGRAGDGPLTGIDRVEHAWLAELIRRRPPFRLVCRTAVGYLVVPPEAAPIVLGWIDDPASLPPTPALGRLIARARRVPTLEAAVRQLAEQCTEAGLMRRIAREGGCPVWLSVGHANLDPRLLGSLGRLAGLTRVVMIHDTIPIDHPDWSGPKAPAMFTRKLRAALAHADLILCPSAATASDVRRWAAVFAETGPLRHSADRQGPIRARAEVVVAPLGVSLAPPDPATVPPSGPTTPYFLALGTIEPRKDHGLLLDVWAHFHATRPPAEIPALLIVGRRGWRNEAVFRRLETEPFMRQTVHELPGLADGAVAALLRGAAALLCPSRAEGYGLPAMEAAALGVPLIATDLPVTRELLGLYPVYAPAGDMYAWANAIITTARQADSGQGRPIPARVPGWEAHFNLVFSRL